MPKGQPKKPATKQTYQQSVGSHRVSADGKELFIGGTRFKRTVLKSAATPRDEDQKLNSELEDIDNLSFKEIED